MRLMWALALRRHGRTSPEGPENEVNPLIDRRFMYTSDGWGTIYKSTPAPQKGEFVWTSQFGRAPEGNSPARAASRCGKTW